MKKLLAIALALVLTLSMGALAETRTRTDVIDGVQQQITETRYESAAGFSLWYRADAVEPLVNDFNDCFVPVGAGVDSDTVLLIVPVDIPLSEADSLIYEATGGYGPEYEISVVYNEMLDNGMMMKSVSAYTDSSIDYYHLVTDGERVLCITALYTLESAEAYAAVFFDMISSLEF